MTNIKIKRPGLIFPVILFLVTSCVTDPYQEKIKNDPHYTKAGFFDLHVCNWPEKDLFFLGVFSTFIHKDIKSVTIFRPNGSELGKFNLKTTKVKKTKNKKTKHISISEFPVNSVDREGWYTVEIMLKGGGKVIAKDYVQFKKMPMVTGVTPEDSTRALKIPETLSWQGVPGASFYKLSIRDMWNDGKVIHTSKLLQKTYYQLPAGLIKPGGWYMWRIHARDVNEDVLLGDFNHGSLSTPAYFLTAE